MHQGPLAFPEVVPRADAFTVLSKIGRSSVAPETGAEKYPLRGQITPDTDFGTALYHLAKRPDVRLVLETGTFMGGGTTCSLGQGLRESAARDAAADPGAVNKLLVSVETNVDAHEYARRSLHPLGLPVRFLLGCTVLWDGIPGRADLERGAQPNPPGLTREAWLRWADEEQCACAKRLASGPALSDGGEGYHLPQPLLPALCPRFPFDLILIDGGEFVGPTEWEWVRDVCKPRYVALHDRETFKTREAYQALAGDPSRWEVIAAASADGVMPGWAIFRDREYVPPP